MRNEENFVDYSKHLSIIEDCDDPEKLDNWIANGERLAAAEIISAARRRKIVLAAASQCDAPDDAMVLDFWKSIVALEHALSSERGKTIRLSRLRPKIARVGVHQTLCDLSLKTTPSEGFHLLRDRDMLDLAAEAVVLRYEDRFDESVVSAARARLDDAKSQLD